MTDESSMQLPSGRVVDGIRWMLVLGGLAGTVAGWGAGLAGVFDNPWSSIWVVGPCSVLALAVLVEQGRRGIRRKPWLVLDPSGQPAAERRTLSPRFYVALMLGLLVLAFDAYYTSVLHEDADRLVQASLLNLQSYHSPSASRQLVRVTHVRLGTNAHNQVTGRQHCEQPSGCGLMFDVSSTNLQERVRVDAVCGRTTSHSRQGEPPTSLHSYTSEAVARYEFTVPPGRDQMGCGFYANIDGEEGERVIYLARDEVVPVSAHFSGEEPGLYQMRFSVYVSSGDEYQELSIDNDGEPFEFVVPSGRLAPPPPRNAQTR